MNNGHYAVQVIYGHPFWYQWYLVDVTVGLQAPSQNRAFLAMFRPGLRLKFVSYVLLRLHPILL